MTEQEAKALVERLKPFTFHDGWHPTGQEEVTPEVADTWAIRLFKVWLPTGSQGDGVECRYSRNNFFFDVILNPTIRLSFHSTIGADSMVGMATGKDLLLHYTHRGFGPPQFGFPTNRPPEINARLKPLADEWMDFFRRGCWLSGCPVEATAHEKAEWMQGFSREELETWNLKM